jgi:hypothetical protein
LSAPQQPPPSRISAFHQLLIILVGSFFLGGSKGTFPDRVRGAVADEERGSRAAAIAERLDARDAEGVRVFAEWHGRFYDLVRRGDSSEEEIRGLLDDFVDEIRRHDEEAVDRLFELRAVMTPEEWAKVFGD